MMEEVVFRYLGISFFLGSLYVAWSLRNVGRRPPNFPPGPPALPILGNIHQMPTKNPHIQFQKWAEKYGPVYSLMLGTQRVVVLSSDVSVKEVLDKKGSMYSDRPEMYISQEVASGGHRLVIMRHNETWRLIRKLVHNILNIKIAAKYVPYQDLENKILLEGLLDAPDALFQHLRRFSFSVSTQLIFGFRCPSYDDPTLAKFFYTMDSWGEVSANGIAQLADLYPILRKLPNFLFPAVRRAQHIHEVGRELYTSKWVQAKNGCKDGTTPPCICRDLFRVQESEGLSDEKVGYIAGNLLEGGSDTTSSTLYGFVLAMLVFQDVQRKAQEEIGRVVGIDRLPDIDDYPNLPYIRCCIKETLRWMPTVIMGVPHCSTKDDTYKEWTFPQGTTFINNVWGIHMDPDRSPEPRRFNPDRYIGDETTLYQSANGDPSKRDNFNFGAGRRLCQGIHIAERSLFLGVSRILWGFDVKSKLDSTGKPIIPDINDLTGGITVHPRPYKADLVPRSPKKVEIMRNSIAEAKTQLHEDTLQWKRIPDNMVFDNWKPGSK